jgi:hypothetical protein
LVLVAMEQVEAQQVQMVPTLCFLLTHPQVVAVVVQTAIRQLDKMVVLRVVEDGI